MFLWYIVESIEKQLGLYYQGLAPPSEHIKGTISPLVFCLLPISSTDMVQRTNFVLCLLANLLHVSWCGFYRPFNYAEKFFC